jgi:hypothetical protein
MIVAMRTMSATSGSVPSEKRAVAIRLRSPGVIDVSD